MVRTAVRESCSEEVAQRLRWHVLESRSEGAECSILTLHVLDHAVRTRAVPSDAPPVEALHERLRPLIRHSDITETDPRRGMAIVLRGADKDGAQAAYLRLRDALASHAVPGEITQKVALGYACGSNEWDADCALEGAIRQAWKPRTIVATVLSHAGRERIAEALGPDGHVYSTRPARARKSAITSVSVAMPATTTTTRQSHLRLLPIERAGGSESEPLRDRARMLGVPFVKLPSRLPAACRRAFSAEVALQLRAVPIGRTRGMLTVAMNDPLDQQAVMRLGVVTGLTIFPVLAALEDI
ncbi:MAG: hypothetical protein ACRDHE_00610 [Ktedonobacterales bacterium]